MSGENKSNSILSTINLPEDIRRLDLVQLNRLAGEIRTKIIETVSRNGGHLSIRPGHP